MKILLDREMNKHIVILGTYIENLQNRRKKKHKRLECYANLSIDSQQV